jgi:hypothetical protein
LNRNKKNRRCTAAPVRSFEKIILIFFSENFLAWLHPETQLLSPKLPVAVNVLVLPILQIQI